MAIKPPSHGWFSGNLLFCLSVRTNGCLNVLVYFFYYYLIGSNSIDNQIGPAFCTGARINEQRMEKNWGEGKKEEEKWGKASLSIHVPDCLREVPIGELPD